jgi:hypothetical protein
VGLWEGVVEGTLISASVDHLSLLLPGAEARYLRTEEILSLQLARPRRLREWLLAGSGIAAATAALVGLATVPGIRLDRDIKTGFLVLFYFGAGLLALLLAKTRLQRWLTSWETLFDIHDREGSPEPPTLDNLQIP